MPEHAKVGKLTLFTRLSNNKPTKRDCKISCQVKSVHNEVTIDSNIFEVGSGRYSISAHPLFVDATNSTVLIDGQHIAGSPFPVYISIHPTQLGKPVRVWRNFCQPHSIIVNSKNEILVTERKGNIFKLTVEGREKLAGAKLRLVRGIACNKEDTAYCIDQLSNNIFKCDQKGMNRKIKNIPLDDEVKG